MTEEADARALAKDMEADLTIIVARWNEARRKDDPQVTVPRTSLYRLLVVACTLAGIPFHTIDRGTN